MDSAPVSSVLGSGGTTSESQDENTISGWPSFHGVNDLNAFFFVVGLGDEKKKKHYPLVLSRLTIGAGTLSILVFFSHNNSLFNLLKLSRHHLVI